MFLPATPQRYDFLSQYAELPIDPSQRPDFLPPHDELDPPSKENGKNAAGWLWFTTMVTSLSTSAARILFAAKGDASGYLATYPFYVAATSITAAVTTVTPAVMHVASYYEVRRRRILRHRTQSAIPSQVMATIGGTRRDAATQINTNTCDAATQTEAPVPARKRRRRT